MFQPNFNNILKVLRCEVPDKPTLFEFFLNDSLYKRLVGPKIASQLLERPANRVLRARLFVHAFRNAGYDYATIHASDFSFPTTEIQQKKTRSLNQGYVIHDRKSFDKYHWLDPEDFDYSWIGEMEDDLPEGMKLIVYGPGGVLENVISLMGYDNLCYAIYDDPQLAEDVFEAVGSRLVKYYELARGYDTVGALISNDDWGFKTQPMLSPEDMRKYVFPWHKRIVETIHQAGKPAILHSCGNFNDMMDEVINDLKYDGKHSYEDAIMPVEEAYEKWHGRIAILGGIDVDYICRATEEEIRDRSMAMIERTQERGGYALGTGNSVPEYIPHEKYFAMISAVNDLLQ